MDVPEPALTYAVACAGVVVHVVVSVAGGFVVKCCLVSAVKFNFFNNVELWATVGELEVLSRVDDIMFFKHLLVQSVRCLTHHGDVHSLHQSCRSFLLDVIDPSRDRIVGSVSRLLFVSKFFETPFEYDTLDCDLWQRFCLFAAQEST